MSARVLTGRHPCRHGADQHGRSRRISRDGPHHRAGPPDQACSPSAGSSGGRSRKPWRVTSSPLPASPRTTVAEHDLCAPRGERRHPRRNPIDPPTLGDDLLGQRQARLAGREGDQGDLADDRRAAPSARARGQRRHPPLREKRRQGNSLEVAGRRRAAIGRGLSSQMRREGYELANLAPAASSSRPTAAAGQRLEPIEEDPESDVDEEFTGIVVDKMSRRKGELQDTAALGRRQAAPEPSSRRRAASSAIRGSSSATRGAPAS